MRLSNANVIRLFLRDVYQVKPQGLSLEARRYFAEHRDNCLVGVKSHNFYALLRVDRSINFVAQGF